MSFESAHKVLVKALEMSQRSRSNLFGADERNYMIREYGMTEAEVIKIEDLVLNKEITLELCAMCDNKAQIGDLCNVCWQGLEGNDNNALPENS